MNRELSKAESTFEPCKSFVDTTLAGLSGVVVPLIPLALTAVGFALRYYNLGADPSHLFDADFLTDEGGWAHNARNRFLYGQWFLGDHDSPYFTAPGYSYMLLFFFKMGGLSIESARMISVISGTITIYLLYLFVVREADRIEASISSLFVAISSYHIMYSTVALIEAMMTMMLMLTLLLWRLSNSNKCFGILSGICFTAMFIVKISAFYFIPIFILLWSFEIIRKEFDWKSLMCFAIGAVIPMTAYFLLFILPNLKLFMYYNFVAPSASGAGFQLRYIFQFLLLNKFLILSPVLTLLSLACLLSFLFRGIENPAGAIRELTYPEVFAVSIILGNSILLAVSSPQPERRYIPMILGLAVLAGHFAAIGGKSARIPSGGGPQNRLLAGLLYGCIFFPLYLFAITTLNPESGQWLSRVLPAGVGNGTGEVGFLYQALLLSPMYVVFILYLAIRRNRRFTYEPALTLAVSGVSACLACSFSILWCEYFNVEPAPGLRLAVFCCFFIAAYLLLKAAGRRGVSAGWVRAVVIAVFVLVEGIQLGLWMHAPTFSILDFGAQIVRETGSAPIITNYSGPFLDRASPVFYGYPPNGSALNGKEGYYILTCYKSNSFHLSPRRIYHPREADVPTEAELTATYEIAPYGVPTKYRWSFVLWHVPG